MGGARLCRLFILVGAFLAISLLVFHKHSSIFKTRNAPRRTYRAQVHPATGDSAPGPAGGGGADTARGPANAANRGTSNHRDSLLLAHQRSTLPAADVEVYVSSTDALREELVALLTEAWHFVSIRLLVSSILLGSGVVLMHFSGMDAMRMVDVKMSVNPVWAGLCFPLAWVGSAVILFFLFHMHGFKRRVVAAVIIGVAVNLVHYFGFFAGTFQVQDDIAEPSSSGEFLMEAEFACVVVTLLSSVARFVFQGTISKT